MPLLPILVAFDAQSLKIVANVGPREVSENELLHVPAREREKRLVNKSDRRCRSFDVKQQRTTGGSAFYRVYDTSDGRQLVLIESGNTLVAFAVPEK